MRTLFLIGAAVGFCGVLAAAHWYPWVSHERPPSETSVVANGGRAEQFLVRLPADRITSTGNAPRISGTSYAAHVDLPGALSEGPVAIDHFKIRNTAGDVIGLAARHWTSTDGGFSSAWSLVLPGRGTLLLAGPGEASGAMEARLRRAGYRTGAAWSGDLRIDMVGTAGGRVLAGSGEFDGLQGRYSETWDVTGIGGAGELRGTIDLGTITYRDP